MEPLPPPLEQKRQEVARRLGRPVYVRRVRTTDGELRGRLRVEPGRVVIEYQVAEAGCFWHVPVIEELLDRAAAGQQSAELREPWAGDGEGPRER